MRLQCLACFLDKCDALCDALEEVSGVAVELDDWQRVWRCGQNSGNRDVSLACWALAGLNCLVAAQVNVLSAILDVQCNNAIAQLLDVLGCTFATDFDPVGVELENYLRV